jgi:hypothetical protein
MKITFAQTAVKAIIEGIGQQLIPILFLCTDEDILSAIPMPVDKDLWAKTIQDSIDSSASASEYILVSEAYATHADNIAANLSVNDIVCIIHVKSSGRCSTVEAIIDKLPDGKRALRSWTKTWYHGKLIMADWKNRGAK